MDANLSRTKTVFKKMAAEGWDLSQPHVWGFFFMAQSRKPLNAVLKELDGHDYRRESIHKAEDGTWVLQVSKVEVLDVEKLHRRNIAFNALAEHCGCDYYDGWDVGQIEPD